MRFGRWWVVGLWGLLCALLLPREALAQDSTNVSAGVESYREFTLGNGLRVVIAVDRRVPQVALHIAYDVGDALDPPAQRGLAQVIGNLLPTLDTRHLRATERSRLLEAAGFKYEEPTANVGLDTTTVALQVPAEALELALWIEADRMGYAADNVGDQALRTALEKARQVANAPPDDAGSYVGFRAVLGPLHPYGAANREAKLDTLQTPIVAARLRRYYNPATAVLVLAGDVDAEVTEQIVRRLFGPLPSAPLTRLSKVERPAKPRLVSLTGASSSRIALLGWETPPYLADDDAGLDVIANVLSHRLRERNVCKWILVAQHSCRMTSAFFAGCEEPVTSTDAWRAALDEELAALAEGRVPAAEIEGAALHYQANVSERYDTLQGRALVIASAVLGGQNVQIVPKRIQEYGAVDAARAAAIVRRHLLRPADGRVEVTPFLGARSTTASRFSTESGPTFSPPVEKTPTFAVSNLDWSRPPLPGKRHRFEPPTGPFDTLPNGDQLRFVEHFGVPVAHVAIIVPWPAKAVNAAARPVLAKLLEESPVAGTTLEEQMRLLGVELRIAGDVDELAIELLIPSRNVAAALDALATVLAEKELPKDKFDAAKSAPTDWLSNKREQWNWYWDALALSAKKSRYEYAGPSTRKALAEKLKLPEVVQLWQATARQPRAIDVVGPFDYATARSLGAKLTRADAARAAQPQVKAKSPFHPGVYVFDREAPKTGKSEVDVCVLWPLPAWATPRYNPAHVMPWSFYTDVEDGLGARLLEHKAPLPYWSSNTTLIRDQDFLRYSFRVPVEGLGPVLVSVKEHLARLGEGHINATALATAIAGEREFQIRQTMSGAGIASALYRAAIHDQPGDDSLDLALQIERLTPESLANLAKTLSFEGAVIGVIGPSAKVSEQLKTADLKPTTVVELETAAEQAGASAR